MCRKRREGREGKGETGEGHPQADSREQSGGPHKSKEEKDLIATMLAIDQEKAHLARAEEEERAEKAKSQSKAATKKKATEAA